MLEKSNKQNLITLLNLNTIEQPKAKYSNQVILQMLEKLPDDFECFAEITRGKTLMVNRGALVECIIRAVITQCYQQTKSKALEVDLDTTKLDKTLLNKYCLPVSKNIEIKFTSSFAFASPKSNKARQTIVVTPNDIKIVDSVFLNKNASGHIKTQQPYGVLMTNLMSALGY